jgi:hypothetical protein
MRDGGSYRRALVVAMVAGCGGGGSSKAPLMDAAVDAQAETSTGDDSGSCFPYCPSLEASAPVDDGGGDAASSCAELQASYEAYEAVAKACNPQLPNPCTATASDPCCPVTVGSSTSAVNDFDVAVARYQAECTADCSKRLCPPAPSGQCVTTGTARGTCM